MAMQRVIMRISARMMRWVGFMVVGFLTGVGLRRVEVGGGGGGGVGR
jgi:hypothetical protein